MKAFLATILLASLALTGCAQLSTAAAIGDAEDAIDQAREAGAEAMAPYEWWSAQAYLDQAKRVDGRSDYAGATRFAQQAKAYAVQATKAAAQARPAEPSP